LANIKCVTLAEDARGSLPLPLVRVGPWVGQGRFFGQKGRFFGQKGRQIWQKVREAVF